MINTNTVPCCSWSIQAALHPTPAVCGRPRDGALAALSAAEPFDRGFYSGPFGWISGAAAEFAVAIRSALVHGDGIVHSSASMAPSPAIIPPITSAPAVRTAAHMAGQNGSSHHNSSPAVDDGTVRRSAAASPDRQRLTSMYAGVGLVCGSDAEKEWQVGACTTISLSVLICSPAASHDARYLV